MYVLVHGWYKKGFLIINKPLDFILLTFIYANGQNLSQLLFRPLTNFSGKVQKIFWTQSFCFDQISYHFVLFMTKIFCYPQISQLPTLKSSYGLNCPFKYPLKVVCTCTGFWTWLTCVPWPHANLTAGNQVLN